ncbi:MAG: hypothetical protein J6W47_08070 [Bacteroidales bacterium]|nr:hypothetical protein [Bacteroidales bacterium]
MFNFLFSHHRSTYIRLAFKFGTTPEHIYKLAHGSEVHGQRDSDIMHELMDLRIVHRHRHSQNPDDYEM